MLLPFSDLKYQRPDFDQLKAVNQKLLLGLKEKELDTGTLKIDFEAYSNLYLYCLSMYHLYLLTDAFATDAAETDEELNYFKKEILQAEQQLNILLTLIADLNSSMSADSLENVAILNQARRIARTVGKVDHQLYVQEGEMMNAYRRILNQLNIEILAEKPAFYTDNYQAESKSYTVNVRDFETWLRQARGKYRAKLYNSFSELLQNYADDLNQSYLNLIANRKQQAVQSGLTYFDFLIQKNKGYGFTRKDMINFKKYLIEYFLPLVEEIKSLRDKRLQSSEQFFYDEFKIAKMNPVSLINIDQPMNKVFLKAMKNIFRDSESDIFNMIREGYWSTEQKAYHHLGQEIILLPYWNRLFLFLNFQEDYFNVEDNFNQIGKALADFSGLLNLKGITTYKQPHLIREVSGMAMQFLSMRQYHLFAKENHELFRDITISHLALKIPLQLALDTFESTIYDPLWQNEMDLSVLWKQIEKNHNIDYNFISDGYFSQGHRWQLCQELYTNPFSSLEKCLAFVIVLAEQPQRDKRNMLEHKLNQLLISNTDLPFVKRLQISGFSSPFEENTIRRAAFALCELLRL